MTQFQIKILVLQYTEKLGLQRDLHIFFFTSEVFFNWLSLLTMLKSFKRKQATPPWANYRSWNRLGPQRKEVLLVVIDVGTEKEGSWVEKGGRFFSFKTKEMKSMGFSGSD
jgi:hypothetical protein